MRFRHSLVLAALALVSFSSLADELTGTWNATTTGPRGQPFPLVFKFATEGDKVTGTLSNSFMPAIPLSDGLIKNKEVSFKAVMPDGTPVAYVGSVDGDKLVLKSAVAGAAPGSPSERSFTATREAGAKP